MPHLRHCIGHTVSSGCKGNKEYFQGLKRWNEIAPGQNPAWYRIKKQTRTSLVQEGDCGISMWNNVTQLIATQEIKVKKNTILIKGHSLKVANNQKRFNDEECNTVTNYAVKDISKIKLSYTVDGRSWRTIDLRKFKNGEYVWNKPDPGLSIKKKFKALRLTDKGKGYILTDVYMKPGAVKLDLYWDEAKGIFTTSVISNKVNTVKSEKEGLIPENWIVRKIQIK